MLSKSLTTSINQIRTILDNMVRLNNDHESKYSLTWNIEQIKGASTTILVLLKVADNTLTLQRPDYLNSNLLDLLTFKRVVEQERKFYSEIVYPFMHLSKKIFRTISERYRTYNILSYT